ncbi:GNAT family N-acetyltransferase [Paenibacillus sp. 7124]|uniref:GNAT family N-acetyltransferase n=1 Tax=Paenibacillus apii TaxID=1850370 RepID=A0A6M1PNG6_9BACL|nr:GNAT family N-acetyltransferase [Paenibacillus apii]
MNITTASLSERHHVENLMQFYIYDFTEFTRASILEDGTFRTLPDLDSYWSEQYKNHIYLIKAGGEVAGFILMKETEDTRKYNYLAHFFILRKFRRSGIGRKAAEIILKKYKGEWELYQLENNIPAQIFWDKVIKDISDGEVRVWVENGRRYQNFFCK